jgi:hypothetical protein
VAPATAAEANATRTDLGLLSRGNPMRLGVEFLPPLAEDSTVPVAPAPVRVEAVAEGPRPKKAPPVEFAPSGGRDRGEVHTWTMSADDLAAVRDPLARETLRFIDEVMGEDRRRLRRDIGTPILTMQTTDMQSPGIDLCSEEVRAEEEAEWLAEHGVDLLRRPFRNLLRRLPVVEGLELQLDEFKKGNVPLTEAYGRAHDTSDLGRMSMRVHAGDLRDPVELAYMHSGIRVGSSQRHLKLGLARRLTDDVYLDVRCRQDYETSQWRWRADLQWLLSQRTSLHFVAGENLDFLTTSSLYSLFESPMDGDQGLLVYAVHLF